MSKVGSVSNAKYIKGMFTAKVYAIFVNNNNAFLYWRKCHPKYSSRFFCTLKLKNLTGKLPFLLTITLVLTFMYYCTEGSQKLLGGELRSEMTQIE